MRSGRIAAALVILALVTVVLVNKCGGQREGAGAKARSGPMSLTGVVVQATSLNDQISSTGRSQPIVRIVGPLLPRGGA